MYLTSNKGDLKFTYTFENIRKQYKNVKKKNNIKADPVVHA